MGINRRDFLKMAGGSILALGGGAVAGCGDGWEIGAPGAFSGVEQEGKRWAMAINIGDCLKRPNCEVCSNACHKIHNVPDFGHTKDEVKWIWKGLFEEAFPDQMNTYQAETLKHKPILVLCNHCDQPPCTKVCPTKATFRREDGIIAVDPHRCIGCRFCVAACPYGSRNMNWRDPREGLQVINPDFPVRNRGMIDKCNFCQERKLADGELPECVNVCPEKALVFGDLNDADSKIRTILAENFTMRRKPVLGTQPQVYYILPPPEKSGEHVDL